jgi:Tfp pilus assembly protein PilV
MRDTRLNKTTEDDRRTRPRPVRAGVMLVEVLAALVILAFVCSSVVLVIDQCVISAADSSLRMEAFQLARENMEKVLASDSITETVEYGRSDVYPDVSWQTEIEAFSEPVTEKMWIRAVCSAEYTDSAGQKQTIKLEHWITELTDQQANQLGGQPQNLEELTAEQVIKTLDEAAQYADVDTGTIGKWIDDGLVTMEDGAFIKHNLDIFVRSDGKPIGAEKGLQVKSIEELAKLLKLQEGGEGENAGTLQGSDGKDRLTGVPQDQLDKMSVGDAMKLLKDRKKR